MKPRRRTDRGTAMVEFALVAPFLVAMFLGVVTFGYTLYTYNRLEDAVRGAARAVTNGNQIYDVFSGKDPALSCGGATTCHVEIKKESSQLAARAANYVVYGAPEFADGLQPVVENLTTDNVAVFVDVRNNRPQNIWVAITNYPLQTPFGSVTLTNKPAAVFPYTGNYAIAP